MRISRYHLVVLVVVATFTATCECSDDGHGIYSLEKNSSKKITKNKSVIETDVNKI